MGRGKQALHGRLSDRGAEGGVPVIDVGYVAKDGLTHRVGGNTKETNRDMRIPCGRRKGKLLYPYSQMERKNDTGTLNHQSANLDATACECCATRA